MAHDEKMLCPFKKSITRELNRKTGKVEITERFMPCAEERCMAWKPGCRCRRLENGNR